MRNPLVVVSNARRHGAHVVYDMYIMRRTQIYLTEEQGRTLERRRKATGSNVSELIRAAIDAAYSRRRSMSKAERVRVARTTAGAWKEFSETGAEYVERIRGRGRLARLHRIK
jgi:myosin heavy subunit